MRGAIKQWDSDDNLPEEKIEEYADMAANVVRYEVKNGYSDDVVSELLNGGEDGE